MSARSRISRCSAISNNSAWCRTPARAAPPASRRPRAARRRPPGTAPARGEKCTSGRGCRPDVVVRRGVRRSAVGGRGAARGTRRCRRSRCWARRRQEGDQAEQREPEPHAGSYAPTLAGLERCRRHVRESVFGSGVSPSDRKCYQAARVRSRALNACARRIAVSSSMISPLSASSRRARRIGSSFSRGSATCTAIRS